MSFFQKVKFWKSLKFFCRLLQYLHMLFNSAVIDTVNFLMIFILPLLQQLRLYIKQAAPRPIDRLPIRRRLIYGRTPRVSCYCFAMEHRHKFSLVIIIICFLNIVKR